MKRPDLYAFDGWMADRRRAVALLQYREAQASRRKNHAEADAMWSAAYDINMLMHKAAALIIEESIDMLWANGAPWQTPGALQRGLS